MGGAQVEPTSFQEFWPTYVSQHLNATCRRMHFAGTGLAIACLLAGPVFPLAPLAAPVVGYGLAWMGHFVFEGNRPASWRSLNALIWSLRGDLRMFRTMLMGRMTGELARAGAGTVPAADQRF
jgi:hypothetical protein